MTVHIGEVTSDVIVEPERTEGTTGPENDSDRWKRMEALRSAQAALGCLTMRTRARAFDD
jgi:hypothetical protein